MYYLMLIVAVIMFSFQFVFNDGFEREAGSSLNSSLQFTLYSSIAGFIVLVVINKLHIEISTFSLLVACVYSIVCMGLGYASLKSFEHTNISVYSVFSMVGGMILPYIYGIMNGEEFKTIRLVCCLLIALSVTMSIKKGKHSRKATKYYILVFILNGLGGIILEFHQSYTGLCVDSGSFMILTRITAVLFSFILLLMQKERKFYVSKKALIYSGLFSILNGVGNLLLLIALLHLPVSVESPVVTGGVIIVSTLIVIARKEQITKREIWAAGIAFIATVLMAV